MSLYKNADVSALSERADDIVRAADSLRMDVAEPTIKEISIMTNVVLDYAKEKKRKIYGGFALNILVGEVSPKDKFYDDNDIPDIDFYSPYPIQDVIEISNRLKEKGFKFVRGAEAQHGETYKIYANTNDCADITYVPKNIYNRIPFKTVDKLYLVGPHFMMVDYMRMMTDPINSYFRIEKSFGRLVLLSKLFPLPKIRSNINISPPSQDLDAAFGVCHDFLSNNKTCIVVGMYAYNHLIKESNIRDADLGKNFKIDYVPVNYYEIISTDYKNDAAKLIKKLKNKFKNQNGGDTITHIEHYPFFNQSGYSVNIYHGRDMVAKIYDHNNKCSPFVEVPALYFKKEKYSKRDGIIKIGTFSLVILHCLIAVMYARTNMDDHTKNLYYTLMSHIRIMKEHFFDKHNKTIFDDTLFKEFVINCIGHTVTPQMERQIRIGARRDKGKKIMFTYDPYRDSESPNTYTFANSSGNKIRKEKNLKISL